MFLKERMHTCGGEHNISGSAAALPFLSETSQEMRDGSFDYLLDAIHDLLTYAETVETLRGGIETNDGDDPLKLYDTTCGLEKLPFLLQNLNGVESEVCRNVDFLSELYLELSSCHHSPWVTAYNDDLVNDTICSQGLQGITWTIATHIAILVFAVSMLWSCSPRLFGGGSLLLFSSSNAATIISETDEEYEVWEY